MHSWIRVKRLLALVVGLGWMLPTSGSEVGRAAIALHSTDHLSVPPYINAITSDPAGRILFAASNTVVVFDGERFADFATGSTLGGMLAILLDCEGPCRSANAEGTTGMPAGSRLYAPTSNRLGYFEAGASGRPGNYVDITAAVPDEFRQFQDVHKIVRLGDAIWFKFFMHVLVLHADGSASGWHDPLINKGAFVHDGHLHVVSRQQGLLSLRLDGREVVATPVAGGEAMSTRGGAVAAELDDGSSLVIAARGIWRLSGAGLVELDSPLLASLERMAPTAAVALRDGHVALATQRDGVHVIDRQGHPREHYGTASGLPTPAARSLFEDADHGLWVGMTAMLARIDRRSGMTHFGAEQGLDGVARLLRHQGRMLAASASGLFELVPGDAPKPARFELREPERPAITDSVSAGDWLWLSSGNLFRTRFDDQGALQPLQRIDGLRQVRALTASRFHEDRIYVSGPGALFVIDQASDATPSVRTIAVSGRASHVVEGDAQTLWLSDGGHRIERIQLSAGGDVVDAFGTPHGLPAEGRIHVQTGSAGPWFLGYDGLMQFDAAGERFVSLSIGGPLEARGSRPFRVDEDSDGNLWVRANGVHGVYWREAGGYRWQGDLFSREFSRQASYDFLREGSVVWIGRNHGVVRLDLDRRRAFGNSAKVLVDATGNPDGNLTFNYALTAYEEAAGRRYRTRLAGWESDWSAWSPLGERSFMRLPPGSYSLAIEASDAYGNVRSTLSAAMRVPTPWSQSIIAYAGYMAMGFLALALAARSGARWRQQAMRQRQRELERIVDERTVTLAEQNQQLAEQAEQLKLADELKTRFFVNVGHEFRTPLTLVMGPLDDVLKDPRTRLGERTREQLELANRNARRVLDLIVELLDVNRMEHGQLPLRREAVDLVSLLQRLVDDSVPLVARFGHRIELICEISTLKIAADPIQIERVVANLIGNAAKFTPRNGQIQVELAEDSERALIRVRDNGRGIAPELLPHVFDRFFRAVDGADSSGYGVGLALSREIVERHGGRIDVASTLGAGSEFTIRLPLATAAAEAGTMAPAVVDPTPVSVASSTADPELDGDGAREPPLVLVVDDHPDLRMRVRQLLESRYRVIEAEDGPTALAQARCQLPDVIVSDVMMPGFDGVELTRRLRADPETAAISLLLLTAKAGADHAVAGLNAGADDYLAKPFDSSELLARIGAMLAQAHRLQLKLSREPLPPLPLPKQARDEDRWRHKLDQVIAEQLGNSAFGVDQLASAMHLDRSALFRRLKAQCGSNPSEFLRERRLQRAHELLVSGAGNVTEVAYAVGFKSLSSSPRAFRQQHGCAPSELLSPGTPRKEVRG